MIPGVQDTGWEEEGQAISVDHSGYVVDELITTAQLQTRVADLGAQINTHYRDAEKLLVVGLLRGSFMFLADLVRLLEIPLEVDFLEVSSYGDAMESSREVRIVKDLDVGMVGRDVLLVEDIIDTGHTMHCVLGMLAARNPASLEVCTLLDKPSRREIDVNARWTGFEIPDEFVVGYGIDYAQRNRNLPYIGKVRFICAGQGQA